MPNTALTYEKLGKVKDVLFLHFFSFGRTRVNVHRSKHHCQVGKAKTGDWIKSLLFHDCVYSYYQVNTLALPWQRHTQWNYQSHNLTIHSNFIIITTTHTELLCWARQQGWDLECEWSSLDPQISRITITMLQHWKSTKKNRVSLSCMFVFFQLQTPSRQLIS